MGKLGVPIEIDKRVNRNDFEDEIDKITTISLRFDYSDNLHTKYFLETFYPIDLIMVGRIIQAFEDLLE